MLWYKSAGFMEDEMLARNPRAMALSGKLRGMGLSEIGARHGKAGVQYGIEGKARRVSLGSRELLLNYFLVSGTRHAGSPLRFDERWNMYKSFSMKQVMGKPEAELESFLRSIADWVGRAPTTIEVRNMAREQPGDNVYASGLSKPKATDVAPDPAPAPVPAPAADPSAGPSSQ
jgi:hypothetical protein